MAEPKFIPKYNGTVFRHPKRADDDIIIKLEGPGVMILRKVRLMRLNSSVLFIIGNKIPFDFFQRKIVLTEFFIVR